jgi:hypothetical protein
MKSAKLYQFPRHGQSASIAIVQPEEIKTQNQKGSIKTPLIAGWKSIMSWIIGLVWLLLGMFWPLLNWIITMDVFFQLLRAVYYSNTPVHATLQAAIHGFVYILLSLFVYLYRPKAF